MSRVIDQDGRQILPTIPHYEAVFLGIEVSEVSAWAVHLACDADFRRRCPAYAALAGHVYVEADQ